jgi:hypothetical protein
MSLLLALTGSGGKVNYALTCSAGSYAISGQAATLKIGRNLPLASGAYAIAGQSAALTVARKLSLATGAYSIAGQSATFAVSRKLALSAGAYAIAGQNATLSYVPGAGQVNYVLSLNAGSYAINGQAAALTVARGLTLNSGSYAIAGNDATLAYVPGTAQKNYGLALNTGAYTINGQSAVLTVTQANQKHGGDDAFHHPHKHTGWNKKAWAQRNSREQAIQATIEAEYRRIMGIEPEPEIIEEIKQEAKAEIATIDYSSERKFTEWLHQEIHQIKQRIESDNEDDEEVLMLMGY